MKWLRELIVALAVGLMMLGIAACASDGNYYGTSIHQGSSWGSSNYGYYHHRYDHHHPPPPAVRPLPPRVPRATPYRGR